MNEVEKDLNKIFVTSDSSTTPGLQIDFRKLVAEYHCTAGVNDYLCKYFIPNGNGCSFLFGNRCVKEC